MFFQATRQLGRIFQESLSSQLVWFGLHSTLGIAVVSFMEPERHRGGWLDRGEKLSIDLHPE
jgi:hypothetical protein